MKKILLVIIPLTAFCLCKSSDPNSHLSYINSKYMFSIKFTQEWENYAAFTKTEIIDSTIDIPAVYFALPTRTGEGQSPNVPPGYADLFHVRIFTIEKWNLYKERYEGTNEFRLSDKIFDGGRKFVYVIRFSNSVPIDLLYYVKSTVSITDSFRILK